MIPERILSHRQILIAVGAFFGLLFGTIVWGVSATFVKSDLESTFETKSRILDGLRMQPVALPRNDESGQFAPRDMVVPALTETLAASELHKKVLDSVERAGGSVRSMQTEVTNDVTKDGLRRLSAQIDFEGTIGVLQKVLFTLETAVPFIFVDSLVIQRAAASAGETAGDRLSVNLVATSYWKTSEATTRQ